MGVQGRKNPNAGRKPKEIDLEYVELLASRGLNAKQIYTMLGIGHTAFYKKKRQKVEIEEALERGRANGILAVTNALYDNCISGNYPAQKFYLCNRDRDNWQDKPDIENNGNTTIIQHLDIEKDL